MKNFPAYFLAACFCLSPSCLATAGQPSRNAEEDFLQSHARIPTDNDSLLKYLQARANQWQYPGQLDDLVVKLGNASFLQRQEATRTLILVGEPALPALRKHVSNSNLELARRAKECAEVIEKNAKEDCSLPIVRLLIARKTPEAFDTLLGFLPHTTDPDVEEEIYYVLDRSIPDNAPMPALLVKALDDKAPARRAVAACIIGRRGNDEQKKKVRVVANGDSDQNVRLRAAQGLLAAHDPAAFPVLISLLRRSSVGVGWQAEELLRWAVGTAAPKTVLGAADEKEQTACHEAWKKWWQDHQQTYRFDPDQTNPGGPCLFLSCWGNTSGPRWEQWEHRIWTMGSDGSQRYVFPIRGKQFRIFDWLPDDRLFAVATEGTRESQLLDYHVGSQKLRSVPINDLEDVYLYRQISPGCWEFGFQSKPAFPYQGQGLNYVYSFHQTDICAKALNADRLNVKYPAWRGHGNSNTPLDGFKLTSDYLGIRTPIKSVLRRVAANGDVHWETFITGYPGVRFFLSLVRFGFAAEPSCETIENRLKLLQSEDPLLRRYASDRLLRFPMSERVYPHAISTLKDREGYVRANMLHWIAKSPSLCLKSIPHLIPMLEQDSIVERGVWSVLEAMPKKESISLLAKVYKDQHAPVVRRARAIFFMNRIHLSKNDPATVEYVREAICDPEASIRKMAIWSMIPYDAAKEFQQELILAAGDEDKNVSSVAITCLAAIGADAAPAIKTLTKAAENKDLVVRHRAVSALGTIGRNDPGVGPFLLGVLVGDNDPQVVAAAAKGLAYRQDNDEKTAAGFVKVLRKWQGQRGDEVRRQAIMALGQTGPAAKDAVPALVELALGKEGVGRQWREIVLALGRIDIKAQNELKRVLRQRLEEDEDEVPRILLEK